jgi:hypothetical protein
VCLYVCDQETPKREAKGPSWTISACEKKKVFWLVNVLGATDSDTDDDDDDHSGAFDDYRKLYGIVELQNGH